MKSTVSGAQPSPWPMKLAVGSGGPMVTSCVIVSVHPPEVTAKVIVNVPQVE